MAKQALHLDPVGALTFSASADYKALRDEWLLLEPHAQDPFGGYAWSAAWYEAMHSVTGQSPIVITGRRADGRLACLLPLVREKKFGLTFLTRPGRSVSGDFAGLFDPELQKALTPQTVVEFWKCAAKSAQPADVLVLNGVRVIKDSPLTHLPHLPASASSFTMQIEEDWEAQYQRLFNSKIKRNDRRSLLRLSECGDMQFLRPQSQQEKREILEVLLQQKRKQIDEQGQNHQLNQPQVLEFYRALPKLFDQSPSQSLVVSALSLNHELIATSCGILANQRYYGMFMAMKGGDTKKFSPGRLLLLDINRYLSSEGCQVHEFGNGEYHYKKTWQCDRFDRVTVMAAASMKGAVLLPVARQVLSLRRKIKVRSKAPAPVAQCKPVVTGNSAATVSASETSA